MIRHAPEVGQEGVIYGDEAAIDLTTTRALIEDVACQLPSPFEADWYHSGVDRAYKTAQALLNAKAIENIDLMEDKAFREQHFGHLIECRHADITDHLTFIDGKIYAPSPPAGETLSAFVARVGAGLDAIKEKAVAVQKQAAVIVCHGGTIRAAHICLHSLDIKDFIHLNTPPLSYHLYTL